MNLNRLDLSLLVALDALLTEQSITKAGQHLNLSPSATSGALARLRVYFSDELLRLFNPAYPNGAIAGVSGWVSSQSLREVGISVDLKL